MQLDLSNVIRRFCRPMVRRRRAAPTISAGGIATPGAVTEDTIIANVQPLEPRRASVLREGLRERATFSVWTSADVRTVDAAAGQLPDVLVYQGHEYHVHAVEAWQDQGGFRELVMVDATAP